MRTGPGGIADQPGRRSASPVIGTEADGEGDRLFEAGGGLLQDDELLVVAEPDGEDDPSTELELLDERGGNLARRRGQKDRVERRLFGPAPIAVAGANRDVGVAELAKPRLRPLGERQDDLDRVDPGGEAGEDRRVVARAGADLEHPVAGREAELLAHDRDDVGLRDRLALADRQRVVGVGFGAKGSGHEQMPRHLGHRGEDAFVADAAGGDLALDHEGAIGGVGVGVARHRDQATAEEGGTKDPPCSNAGAGHCAPCRSSATGARGSRSVSRCCRPPFW